MWHLIGEESRYINKINKKGNISSMYTEENKMPYREDRRDDILDEILSRCEMESMSCSCKMPRREKDEKSFGLVGYPLAMVYAPIQEWKDIYDLDKALEKGTLFGELDLPFEGANKFMGGCCNG